MQTDQWHIRSTSVFGKAVFEVCYIIHEILLRDAVAFLVIDHVCIVNSVTVAVYVLIYLIEYNSVRKKLLYNYKLLHNFYTTLPIVNQQYHRHQPCNDTHLHLLRGLD